MDNIFKLLMSILKMLGVPEKCIQFLTKLFQKGWNEVFPNDNSQIEKIKIQDAKWVNK